MKILGTRGGINISLAQRDSSTSITKQLTLKQALLTSGLRVTLEVAEEMPWESIHTAVSTIESLGGRVTAVRPVIDQTSRTRGNTKIIARTVRSGGRVESSGSAIILGDVNAGAEIIAADDVIVIGKLRGIAHAGAEGNEQAVIWAQELRAPQLRIGSNLLESNGLLREKNGSMIAYLQNGDISVQPWQ